VSACGICGSDVHGFQGKSRIRVPPMVMGHEFSGRVVSANSESRDLQPGQRVVVQPLVGCGQCSYCAKGKPNICPRRELIGAHRQGAFAEFVRVPAHLVYPIAPSLSDSAGTLVEPLANAVHMLGLGGGALDLDVVILGAGTLGLVTTALAHFAGARRVIVTDVDDRRLQVALKLGADEALNARQEHVTDYISEVTGGGADLVIDAAGYTPSRQQGIAVAAPGGTVVLLGLADPTSEVSFLDVINREIAVRGSYASTDSDFRHALAILESGKIDTESWVQSASLEEGQRYFDALSSHDSDLVKVVFSIAE
jgi:2-desacetyl-2-hydroxyethyl bacteriochlorophyllide A dehydrogenase